MTKSSALDHAKAWGDFWQANIGSSTGARAGTEGGGCLPARWSAIEEAQKGVWAEFASGLPENAKVLDLATGDGRVLGWMANLRSDLDLHGVDLAPALPAPPQGVTTQGSVRMEALPSDDGAYDAIVSQFGFEYGNVRLTAGEIARVLKPGGTVGLIVHRGDGPILEHNAARRAAIRWVLDEEKAGDAVRRGLAEGANAAGGGAQQAHDAAAKVARTALNRYGEGSPGWEIAEAMRRSVVGAARSGNGPAAVRETVAIIETQARNEMARIISLEHACRTADDRDTLNAALAANGFAPTHQRSLREPNGRAFADMLIFSRS